MSLLQRISAFLVGISSLIVLCYFTERSNFYLLFGLFTVLFSLCFLVLRKGEFAWKQVLFVGLLLRASTLFMTPNLSDDYWRFVWDGRLLSSGHNPYLYMPNESLEREEVVDLDLSGKVYENLNSKQYYTIYPPLNQLFFATAASLGNRDVMTEVIILRLLLILFEWGAMLLLVKLLIQLKKPPKLMAWYAFNPLVLVEVSGNLHFEGVMLFFILLSVYLWKKSKHLGGAMSFAAAISTKLLPAMFLPLWIRESGWSKGLLMGVLAMGGAVLTFLPFLSVELVENMGSSVDLYFRSFEFNASVYYLVREVGQWVTGYNIIAVAGPALSLISLTLILFLSGRKQAANNLFRTTLFIFTVYLLLTTTVHPWYLITLVGLAPLAGLRYPLAWSFLVILSYSHYMNGFHENYMLIALEYLLLVLVAWRFDWMVSSKITPSAVN